MDGNPSDDRALSLHIVGEDDAVREALRRLFRDLNAAFRTHESVADLIAGTAPEAHGCLVLDLRMPGAGPGPLKRIRAERPGLKTIMLTANAEVDAVIDALRSGAVDFIEKPWRADDMRDAVRRALAQAEVDRRQSQERGAAQLRLSGLTPRERDVLRELVAGSANKEIARALGLSPRTVEFHRHRVFEKTGAASVAELVRLDLQASADPHRLVEQVERHVDRGAHAKGLDGGDEKNGSLNKYT